MLQLCLKLFAVGVVTMAHAFRAAAQVEFCSTAFVIKKQLYRPANLQLYISVAVAIAVKDTVGTNVISLNNVRSSSRSSSTRSCSSYSGNIYQHLPTFTVVRYGEFLLLALTV